MFTVVGYRDLRPVDWLSGKRMPLDPGEGHVCDRCGAEHAVVYTVLDSDTGRRYEVGSGCAKQQFGFEPNEQREVKSLVRAEKERVALEVDEARQRAASELADTISREVSDLVAPPAAPDAERYAPRVAWRVGDGIALTGLSRTDDEAKELALRSWAENRVRERVPPELSDVELLLRPGTRDKTKVGLKAQVTRLAMDLLLPRTSRTPYR